MNIKESIEQLQSLIEHFNNGGLDFNATDIAAIKCLLNENQELKTLLKGTTHCFDEEEHKQLEENNKTMQEEMARTWVKLEVSEKARKDAIDYITPKLCMKSKYGYLYPLFKRTHVEQILEILDIDKGE